MSGQAHPSPLPIRLGMDVYGLDGTYLGSVARVHPEPSTAGTAVSRRATAGQTGSQPDAAENPPLRHEEGAATSPTPTEGKPELGEEMGPFPTIAVGNTGPVVQSAAHHYATGNGGSGVGVGSFEVRPGRINLGPLTPVFHVPVAAVRSISMERVVLDLTGSSIPAEWRSDATALQR